MAIKRVTSGNHGVLRGNLRQNRERRYLEAVDRQAKYNDKHSRNMCERGCQPNPPEDGGKVIACGPKIKKPRKHKVKKIKE